jgi:hypothetical protein
MYKQKIHLLPFAEAAVRLLAQALAPQIRATYIKTAQMMMAFLTFRKKMVKRFPLILE